MALEMVKRFADKHLGFRANTGIFWHVVDEKRGDERRPAQHLIVPKKPIPHQCGQNYL